MIDNSLILSLTLVFKIGMFKKFLSNYMMVIILVFCNAVIKVHDKALIDKLINF